MATWDRRIKQAEKKKKIRRNKQSKIKKTRKGKQSLQFN